MERGKGVRMMAYELTEAHILSYEFKLSLSVRIDTADKNPWYTEDMRVSECIVRLHRT